MNRIIFFIGIVLLISTGLMGQTRTAYLEAAETSYIEKDYYSSLLYYMEAYEFDTTATTVIRGVAESARKANVYRTSERFYQKLMDMDISEQKSEDIFWLANAKHKQGEYEEARILYSTYLSEYAEDDLWMTRRAEKEIKSCEWSQSEIINPRENITIERLGAQVNDIEFADFAPNPEQGGLSYTSLRYRDTEYKSGTSRLLSKRLNAKDDYVEEILTDLNEGNKFVGHTTFNNTRNKIYYTLCDYNSGYNISCELYQANIDGANSLSNSERIENLNALDATTTQPSYAYNSNDNTQRLYFASDREGGKGGLDIWYATIESNGEFSEPINLSQINSIDNEITPYYHDATNEFFFSSDGYLGFGGYDVYKSTLNNSDTPIHLGAPINSSYNDIYYIVNEGGREAYFSTNRFKNDFHDNETEPCCYDIYKTTIEEVDIKLNAKTFETNSRDSLYGATVDLFDVTTGDLLSTKTPVDGIDHMFDLVSDNEYMIIGRKNGYGSDTIYFSTIGMYETKDVEKNLFLDQSFQRIELTAFDEFTREPLNGIEIRVKNVTDPTQEDIILYDMASFNQLDLDPNSTYEITVSKENYEPETLFIYPSDDPSKPVIRQIYLKRVLFGIYLPTLLYFDNDRPNVKSMAETTEKSYSDTYDPYIERKPVFVNQIRKSRSFAGDKEAEIANLESFFENDVKTGYATFQKFLDAMHEELKKGFGFEILIKGFTSPLAQNEYNKALGKRRVQSIRNEIDSHEGGILLAYINNGLLKITDVSYGEELAPSTIIDNPQQPASSIYSTEASRERRVEIIEVKRIFKNTNSQ
jgi:outer membrane protein OmpA-like peptidoglycan-associated protein